MKLLEFYHYKEKAFDGFCKTMVRNTSVDCKREIIHQRHHEMPYSALSYKENEELLHLVYEDVPHPEQTLFWAQGKPVQIEDRALARALRFLLPDQRDMVLLFYFWDYSDRDIADLMHCSADTVRLRRSKALRRLRQELESMPDDI